MAIGIACTVILGIFLGLKFFEKYIPVNERYHTCLVTGASSGIGCELARQMVHRGWKVIGIARRVQLLDSLATELGKDNFIPYICDVGNPEEVHTISEQIKARGLKPTLFFLNAGMGGQDLPYQISTQQHKTMFNVNYFGVVAWVEEWLAPVKSYGGGTFVATSSIFSLYAPPARAGYSASKTALNSCFKSLRLQYLSDNINFAVVAPGPVATAMLKTRKPLPCIRQPAETARYIIDQVFKGERFIEPTWFYKITLPILKMLPDTVVLKILAPFHFECKK